MSNIYQQDFEFVPCQESLRFFSTKKTISEVTQKVHNLHNEQKKVEEELRKEVRKHYRTFLYTNKEIENIGNHVAELKILVEDTIELVHALKSIDIKQQESGVRNKRLTREKIEESDVLSPLKQSSTSSMPAFPTWVLTAPETIDKLIVQHQFQQATELVLNVRKYRKGVDENFQKIQKSVVVGGSSPESKFSKYKDQYESLIQCCNEVDVMVTRLIDSMSFALPHLANSKLWGYEEHNRRLKLLVALGSYESAAIAFCDSKRDLASRSLSIYQPTGDSLAYIQIMMADTLNPTILSPTKGPTNNNNNNTHNNSNTSNNHSNNSSPRMLPEPEYDINTLSHLDPLVLTYLQDWTQSQIVSFLKIIMTQLRVGVNEKVSNIFIGLRSLYSLLTGSTQYTQHNHNNSNSKDLKISHINTNNDNIEDASDDDDNDDDDDDEEEEESEDEEEEDEEELELDQVVKNKTSINNSYNYSNPIRKISSINALDTLQNATIVIDTADKIMKEVGPHMFIAQCLSILCAKASQLDRLTCNHIQGKSCVCLHIVPELQRILNNLGDMVIQEMRHWLQIQKHEEWKEHENLCWSVIPPDSNLSQHLQKQKLLQTKSTVASKSPAVIYDWIVLIMSQYIQDIWILFTPEISRVNYSSELQQYNNENNSTTNSNNNNIYNYTKLDISESESAAIASIIRVILRFCIELESAGDELIADYSYHSVNNKSQENMIVNQITCFVNTLKAVVLHLIPSIHSCIISFFSKKCPVFENHTPQDILQMLCQRLEDKGKLMSKLVYNHQHTNK